MRGTTVALGEHIAFQPTGSVELDVDWVVVGSGAGGSTAALELARAGLSVALVESGPWRDPEHYPASVYGAMRDMWSDWGMGYARGDSMIPIVQAAAVGGTTTINSAILADPPEEVIAGWGALGLGEALPVEGVLSAAQAAALDISAAPAAGGSKP